MCAGSQQHRFSPSIFWKVSSLRALSKGRQVRRKWPGKLNAKIPGCIAVKNKCGIQKPWMVSQNEGLSGAALHTFSHFKGARFPSRGWLKTHVSGRKHWRAARRPHIYRDAVCFTEVSLWSVPMASFSVFVILFLIRRNYEASLKIKLPGFGLWNEWWEKLARLITFNWHCIRLVGTARWW